MLRIQIRKIVMVVGMVRVGAGIWVRVRVRCIAVVIQRIRVEIMVGVRVSKTKVGTTKG